MRRVAKALFGLILLQSAACGDRAAPPTPAGSPTPPAPVVQTETYTLFGGDYVVELQTREAMNVHTKVDNSWSGSTKRKWAELTWEAGGKQHGSLVLDADRLTVNGVARGEVPLGSRIVIDPSGGVTVTPGKTPPPQPGSMGSLPTRKK